jgi:tRNA1(Val) A37 N6-methylase TrmN6
MNYIIDYDSLLSNNFNEYYYKYKDIINDKDIYQKPGQEHYRLLSYFSTLFSDCNIINIGTNIGNSSLALSYNKKNTIYSFEITDTNYSNYNLINNINFRYIDIFNDEIQKEWSDVILIMHNDKSIMKYELSNKIIINPWNLKK